MNISNNTKILRGKTKHQRGITLFFAILIISLMLGIGISISTLSQKQISISTFNKQSELAFYSADSAMECALYHDSSKVDDFNPSKTAIGSSFNITCAGNSSISVAHTSVSGVAHYDFTSSFAGGSAHVTLDKTLVNCVGTPSSCLYTTVIQSKGYNTSNTAAPRRLERAIYLSY